MSSSPTAPTSTTGSSTSSPSRPEPARAPRRRSSPAARSPSPRPRSSRGAAGRSTYTRCRRCCTTSPQLIAGEVEPAGRRAGGGVRRRSRSATPTAAPTAPSTRSATSSGCARLAGLHCYDVYAGAEPAGERSSTSSPAPTCSPTSWCAPSRAPSCASSAWTASPELRDDYFGHYTRVVWLAQEPDDPELRALAERRRRAARPAADRRRRPATHGLEAALEALLPDVPSVGTSAGRQTCDGRASASTAAAPAGRVRQASVSATWLKVKTCSPSTSASGRGQRRGALLEEPLAGEAAGRGEPGEGALVLGQEPGRLADPDLGRPSRAAWSRSTGPGMPSSSGIVTPRAAHPADPGRRRRRGRRSGC